MRVAQKVRVIKYLRDIDRKIKTTVVEGTIVSPVKYTREGVHWHWCVLK